MIQITKHSNQMEHVGSADSRCTWSKCFFLEFRVNEV